MSGRASVGDVAVGGVGTGEIGVGEVVNGHSRALSGDFQNLNQNEVRMDKGKKKKKPKWWRSLLCGAADNDGG